MVVYGHVAGGSFDNATSRVPKALDDKKTAILD